MTTGDPILICTADPVEDLGSGVHVERRHVNGVLDGIAWWHPCGPDNTMREDYMPMQPAWKDGWVLEQAQPLTLSPSVLCRACKLHGFIRVAEELLKAQNQ